MKWVSTIPSGGDGSSAINLSLSRSAQAEHQPRLVAGPVGIELGHRLVEFVLGGGRLLEPAEGSEVALAGLDGRRGVRGCRPSRVRPMPSAAPTGGAVHPLRPSPG